MDGSIRAHLEHTCGDPWSPTNRIGCVDTHEPAALPEPRADQTEVMDEAVARELCANAASWTFEMVLGNGNGFDGLGAKGRDYWLRKALRLR